MNVNFEIDRKTLHYQDTEGWLAAIKEKFSCFGERTATLVREAIGRIEGVERIEAMTGKPPAIILARAVAQARWEGCFPWPFPREIFEQTR